MCYMLCDSCEQCPDKIHAFQVPYRRLVELWICDACLKLHGEVRLNYHTRDFNWKNIDLLCCKGVDFKGPVDILRTNGIWESDWVVNIDRAMVFDEASQEIRISFSKNELEKYVPLRRLCSRNETWGKIYLDMSLERFLAPARKETWKRYVYHARFFAKRLLILMRKLPRDIVRVITTF